MNREELRTYFKECGLTYNHITLDDLRLLELTCNKYFTEQNLSRLKGQENRSTYWVRVNSAKYYKGEYDSNGCLICAFITAKGRYFNAREAISFNRNGFIGFCGESDNNNLVPVAQAFIEWCDYIASEERGRSEA